MSKSKTKCIVCGLVGRHSVVRCGWRNWRITRETGMDAMTRYLLRNVPASQVTVFATEKKKRWWRP